MYSLKRQFGNEGEDLVVADLRNGGYKIIKRNYLKKWGEIDIIAFKDNKLHFIEVKTVSKAGEFRPEDNLHELKLKRFGRTVETFLAEYDEDRKSEWQCDIACVLLEKSGESKIEYINDVIL